MKKLKILYLEDNKMDVEIAEAHLNQEEIEYTLVNVDNRSDFISALEKNKFDLILSDYSLPAYDGLSAIKFIEENYSDIPAVVISGTLGEEAAIEMLKSGATDYVMKQRMSRFIPSINRALKEAEERNARKRAEKTQTIIFNITNAVITTDNLKEFIKHIREQLGTIIDTTNFFVALYDESTDSISLLYHKDKKDKAKTFPAGKTLTKYVIKTKKSLLATKDVKDKLEKSGEVELIGADSKVWLGVPLFAKGKVSGVIAIQSYEDEKAYNESDMRTLEIISHQISISLERKKAEQNLKSALEKAQESDRLKSAFLANMSHEFRTPMNGILGFAQLLREPDLTGEEQQKYLGIMEKSGERMLDIISAIVSISKIESGSMEVSMSDTNVNEQIEFIYDFFKPAVEEIGIHLVAKKALPSKEAIITSDREKIYAILTNLVGNATKFTKKGSIELGYEKKGKYLEFFVKDTGDGIADEKKEIIFERFRQGSESYNREYEGAGLGLSISKAYVEMLGGKIWVESELGKGSTFYFTIPFSAETEPEIITEESVSLVEKNGIIKKLKILMVEDDEASEQFLSLAVKSFDKGGLKARNGIEAIEVCRNNPGIDLILMDIRMPEMNGYEATRQIREFNQEVVIIAQTAYGLSSDREKAIEAGCNDYISKPIDVALLKALIKKYFK
ncbi:MAG: response regulator [Deltaproteobacteria bacterium]|nr:response regulator [Candidatus Desulfobacula maris]MBL6964718.1 response regulator [Bacteroidota bacterium]